MNSEMKRRNFANDLSAWEDLYEEMQGVDDELLNIARKLSRFTNESMDFSDAMFRDVEKAREDFSYAIEGLKKQIDFEREDFSREFASEAGVVGLLIDQLANSMEFFDEEGWVEFLGPDLDEDSAREIYKNYWLISPNDRLKWNDSQWGTWLERYI